MSTPVRRTCLIRVCVQFVSSGKSRTERSIASHLRDKLKLTGPMAKPSGPCEEVWCHGRTLELPTPGGRSPSSRCRTMRTRPSWPRPSSLCHLSAAGVRRRGAQPEGAAGRGRRRARPSCCRAATAPRASPSSSADNIRDTFRVLLQMAVVLTFAGGMPVVKVGRMAGQFAKPRSAPTETHRRRRAAVLSRRHHQRHRVHRRGAHARPASGMIQAYSQSAATLNLLRAFAQGGYADLHNVHRGRWASSADSPQGERYRGRRRPDRRGARLHGGLRRHRRDQPQLHETDFFTSHEALLLPYEQAMTRVDSASPATGTTPRRTCCGSATAPASSTAPMSSSCAASRTRSA